MTYEQAKEDHEYLWETYGPADDMTGGYVDSEDLDKMLKTPSKKMASKCLKHQIYYWFQVGTESGAGGCDAGKTPSELVDDYPEIIDIAERYFCEIN